MSTLEQDYEINAPVEKVWQALTDAKAMTRWSGAPAQSDPNEGGTFSLWKGDIHGTYMRLVLNETIEQDWYGHDNPGRKYHVIFSLTSYEIGTKVHMIYSGDIIDKQKDINDWRDYYFDPIKVSIER